MDALSFPIRMGGPAGRKPLYADPAQYGPTIQDDYGVVWNTSTIDRGAPIGPCITESTLEGYTFPDPTQEWRFQDVGAWCARQEGHYRVLWVGALWEQATFIPVIPDMIEIGLDILHPIQPEAMDIAWLKKEFGKDLTLCGGVRTQDFLATVSPDEVRQEVRRLKREMGHSGGYILEPGITILADVPPANIYALVDEARMPGR